MPLSWNAVVAVNVVVVVVVVVVCAHSSVKGR
jgi:hypothetical protein